jgi:D-lactate dehydrogenase (cytochrome)
VYVIVAPRQGRFLFLTRYTQMPQDIRTRPDQSALDATLADLAALLGNRLVTSRAVCEQHANTTTWVASEAPDAVAFPQTTEDVQQIVRACARWKMPLIPFGTGTSFEGSVNAPFGGISVDLKDMNRIIAVHAEDMDCVVEPGVTRKQLNDHLRDLGLFFPVDPGADASLGGMASTRASGTTAVRYGTMKDNVLALKVVLSNGEVMSTARRARKSSAGYDLTRLIVGAEGTLGIITEMTVKLHGIPEATAAGVCPFASVEECCQAAIAAIQAGIPMARVELLNAMQVRVCNAYSKLGLAELPMLFVEFHGTHASVAEQSERFGAIVGEYGGGPFDWSQALEARTRLWKARHDVFWALTSYRAGAKVVATDVCVPISRLAECVVETQRDSEACGVPTPIVGHVGDGNFHASLFVMMDDPTEIERAKGFIDRVAERALAMEGTCTGEHGIGQGKKRYLEPEHGAAAVEVMRAIKHALDPAGIMNPGKIV